MNNGLYTATTAMLLNQQRMDVVSNNIANLNTNGYKKDVVVSQSFPEVLLSKINDGVNGTNQPPFTGVEMSRNGDVFTISTSSGYFRVKTPEGISNNRELQFSVDENGYLRTYFTDSDGNLKSSGENYVLGSKGLVKVADNNIDIDKNGNLLYNGQTIDKLVSFPAPQVIGTASAGVRLDRIVTNFTQGNLVETGNPLDFALKGEGFFKVYNGQEEMYTRDGSFTINENRELITTEGHLVIGQYGSIVLGEENFEVNEMGQIIQNGEIIDTLDIVKLENIEDLRKQGNNVYKISEGSTAQESQFEGQLLTGYVEGSNVDAVKEMVKMISLMRSFESSQKMVKYQDEMLGKAINEIAKL